jgi:hypothetical protein
MAYTLAIYTHKSTGKDRGAAETVAEVLLGTGWSCNQCSAAYIGTPPSRGIMLSTINTINPTAGPFALGQRECSKSR